MPLSHLVIDKIAYKKVYRLLTALLSGKLGKLGEDSLKRSLIQTVIRIKDLEVKAGGIFKACIHSLSMTSIFLMYGPYYARIAFLIALCYPEGIIFCRAIIYDEHLHKLASGEG